MAKKSDPLSEWSTEVSYMDWPKCASVQEMRCWAAGAWKLAAAVFQFSASLDFYLDLLRVSAGKSLIL